MEEAKGWICFWYVYLISVVRKMSMQRSVRVCIQKLLKSFLLFHAFQSCYSIFKDSFRFKQMGGSLTVFFYSCSFIHSFNYKMTSAQTYSPWTYHLSCETYKSSIVFVLIFFPNLYFKFSVYFFCLVVSYLHADK